MESIPTIGLAEAAALLRVSEDTLLRRARAGIVPGAKVGREWVFIQADLLDLIREQAKARACRSTAILRAPTGGSASPSAESRLDAALARLRKVPPKNLKRNFALISGGKSNSESDRAIHGAKPSNVGTTNATPATANERGSG
jgi:hypothetical protein